MRACLGGLFCSCGWCGIFCNFGRRSVRSCFEFFFSCCCCLCLVGCFRFLNCCSLFHLFFFSGRMGGSALFWGGIRLERWFELIGNDLCFLFFGLSVVWLIFGRSSSFFVVEVGKFAFSVQLELF